MSVTASAGFRAGAIHAGIKPDGALDLALVVSDRPVPTAAVFTTSRTAAPPVVLSRRRLQGAAQAVVLNSGCANAGTGADGMRMALATTAAVASALDADPDQVLVCSTGPIGPSLPEHLPDKAPDLVATLGADGTAAALGIMTTDSIPKEAVHTGAGWTVGGMAKGAGMIRPDMATMLAVLTTDALVGPAELDRVLRAATDRTFNCLNLDGCQSTNDTVLLMASGTSGERPDLGDFESAVEDVSGRLAMMMAQDAEGASRVVTIEVVGAPSNEQARLVGRAIADSALVRSSFYGGDPNWGRVFGALGVAGVPVDPDSVGIAYNGVAVAAGGIAAPHDRAALVESIRSGTFTVAVTVGDQPGSATIVTTDLTPEYVVFNGEPS